MFKIHFSKLFFLFFCINILSSQIDHQHSHSHKNEIGMAIGLVPGHEEENNIGLHLHYVKGLGEHNHFGLGLSLETIFDEHLHNSISLLGLYHFDNGFTMAYAPGILFSEDDGNSETHFTQHFEFYYEIELDKFHIGPQFDIGIEDGDLHYMFGIHFGIDVN
jgi:hypothetical protein